MGCLGLPLLFSFLCHRCRRHAGSPLDQYTHTHTTGRGFTIRTRGHTIPHSKGVGAYEHVRGPAPTPHRRACGQQAFGGSGCFFNLEYMQPPRNCGCKLWPQLSAHLQKLEHCCRSDEGDCPSTSVAKCPTMMMMMMTMVVVTMDDVVSVLLDIISTVRLRIVVDSRTTR